MSEIENVVEPTPEEVVEPEKKSSESFGAKLKERFRKLIVKLKRQTHLIPLVVILITSLVYLCFIGTFSQVIEKNSGIKAGGIAIFVNTLLSILVLPLFLNAFPKRKQQNLIYTIAVFVVLAVMVGMDILLYWGTHDYITRNHILIAKNPEVSKLYAETIVHMVFLGISIVVFALLPLYKKGINKIDTTKKLDENNLSEEIDTSAEV